MCNEYERDVPVDQIAQQFSQIRIPLRWPEGKPNLGAARIRITDTGTIVRTASDGSTELVQRRWSWPGPSGKPVFNYRSDNREFSSGRCLILATGFFEFTAGQGKTKDRWLFTKKGEPLFSIAGIWRTDEKVGEAFTMLTTAPGPDIAPYHDRQVAVLERDQWARWLDPSVSVKGMIGPLPAGSLEVRKV